MSTTDKAKQLVEQVERLQAENRRWGDDYARLIGATMKRNRALDLAKEVLRSYAVRGRRALEALEEIDAILGEKK